MKRSCLNEFKISLENLVDLFTVGLERENNANFRNYSTRLVVKVGLL